MRQEVLSSSISVVGPARRIPGYEVGEGHEGLERRRQGAHQNIGWAGPRVEAVDAASGRRVPAEVYAYAKGCPEKEYQRQLPEGRHGLDFRLGGPGAAPRGENERLCR